MKKLKIKTRVALFVVSSGIGFIFITGLFFFLLFNQSQEDLRSQLDYGKNTNLKNQVEVVLSLLDSYYQKSLEGKLSLEEAKEQAANHIRGLTYDEDNYFWIDTKEGKCLVLYGSGMEGTNRLSVKDSHGKNMVRDMIQKSVASGGGFTTYYFPRKGQTVPLPKRAYSGFFQPFGWVVGTGVYIDDIDKELLLHGESMKKTFGSFLLLLLIIVSLGSGMSVVYAIRQTKPLEYLKQQFECIEKGDLSVLIEIEGDDEYGQMGQAASRMVSSLRSIINAIMFSSRHLGQASKELRATANQISAGSSEQASSAEEVSSSMEEMQANIDQNANNAGRAEVIVTEAVKTMQQLSDTSLQVLESVDEITNRIGIINDIANKTNILALNAAVESAHAGEHGKGFAVVASEVRNLAENSKMAAERIVGLANNTHTINQKVREEVQKMLPEIENTFNYVKEISAASVEQASGAMQINNAVMQLSQIAQKSASASEELAASSEMLEKEAALLEESIRRFKL